MKRQAKIGWAAAVAVLVGAGCERSQVPPVPPGIAAQVGTVEAPAEQNLLVFPTGDAESLLGRSVQLSADGGWTIADGVAPGCEVRTHRELSEFRRTYTAELGKMASLAAGYEQILGLTARYGSEIVANVEIRNSDVWHGDFRGDCGTHVIDTVFVGTGSRRLERSREAGVSGGAKIESVPLSGSAGSTARVEAAVSWETPQAYAFTFRQVGEAEAVRLDLRMPTRVAAGERFALQVQSSQDARLIVYFLEESGEGGVLFPSSDHADTKVVAGRVRSFPAFEASLREPSAEARETLVVYALTDERDYERLKPPPGDQSTAGARYAARLTEELAKIPMQRWGRTTFSYVIEPAPTP